jgi:hypothetical protein
MSCPALRYEPQNSGQETKIINLFPRTNLKFGNFSVAILPTRPRNHYSRQRRTSWRIFPLRSVSANGTPVEKFAFKSFTGPVFSKQNPADSRVYRMVCVSTIFRVAETNETKIS